MTFFVILAAKPRLYILSGNEDHSMKQLRQSAKLWIGILVSLIFLWLAFRKTDPAAILHAFRGINPYYLAISVIAPFVSHWLRAWRWRYLLMPLRSVSTPSLLSSLLIGYMANTFLPAHLGELLRGVSLSRKEKMQWSEIMATIVLDRIIDMFSLGLLMGGMLLVFPFPGWVKKSGLIMTTGTLFLFVLLFWMRRYRKRAERWFSLLMKILPNHFREKAVNMFHSFLEGLKPLAHPRHYPLVVLQSLLIWLGYAGTLYILFLAFGFTSRFGLAIKAALVLQVITTISVVVPSSPGYVGTYHYLCQVGLGFFSVPAGAALGFAFVAHAVNFIPILAVGLCCMLREGMNLRSGEGGKAASPVAETEQP